MRNALPLLVAERSIDMRADCERRHEETLDAVRATAQEQVAFNVREVHTLHLAVFGLLRPAFIAPGRV